MKHVHDCMVRRFVLSYLVLGFSVFFIDYVYVDGPMSAML